MTGLRPSLARLAFVLALAAGSAPLHATCPLGVSAVALSDAEAERIGSNFTAPDHTHPANPPTGGMITEIKAFYNHTPCIVTVYKLDHFALAGKHQGHNLGPDDVYVRDMWVPWADDWYSPQRLVIAIGDKRFFEIWQKGNRLAFRNVDQHATQTDSERRDLYNAALSVPGTSASGGRRHLHIKMTPSGGVYFSLNGVE